MNNLLCYQSIITSASVGNKTALERSDSRHNNFGDDFEKYVAQADGTEIIETSRVVNLRDRNNEFLLKLD